MVDDSRGDSLLLEVLDVVDKSRAMAEEVKNGDGKEELSEDRQESQKRRRSRSPINGPGAGGRRGRGRGGGRRYGGYRSWDRAADGIDNKTNSDEPHLKRARLFVGNIATDSVTRRDLAELFGQYGRVLGISVHGGFAFVQLDRERDANRAVVCEDGRNFKGSKIHVEFSQAAKEAGARRASQPRTLSPPPPRPLAPMRERERDYASPLHLEDQRLREERLERVLLMEREMAYLQAREDIYNEMVSRSQPEPPSVPLFEHRREESYRRPPLSPPPPSNPYPPSRERDYPMDRPERSSLDDRRPYYSRSEASSSYHAPESRSEQLLSYPLPRNRSGNGGHRGADLLAAAYGGAATSGKSVGYGSMSGNGGGGSGGGGYSLGKSSSGVGSSWGSSHDYPRGGSSGGGSRGGPYSGGSSGYWN